MSRPWKRFFNSKKDDPVYAGVKREEIEEILSVEWEEMTEDEMQPYLSDKMYIIGLVTGFAAGFSLGCSVCLLFCKKT